MFSFCASRVAVVGWPISAIAFSSSRVLDAAGILVTALVCLKSQTLASDFELLAAWELR